MQFFVIPEVMYGAPARSRTRNLLIRSQALYPIELRAHNPGHTFNRVSGMMQGKVPCASSFPLDIVVLRVRVDWS